jgi:2,3-bisphosphoglycerate-independent phosphoglycerate mutase
MDLPKAAELEAEIPRTEAPAGLHYVCMTQYDKKYTLPQVIPPESMENLLAHLMERAGLRNLRVAETEKYAHVTYFFNGGIEKPFAGEDRVLVPSQKVATYDLAPEMSAAGIADAVIKAVETVDRELGRIYREIRQRGGRWLVTADHGNAELMIDPVTGGPHTAHTTNPVPFILVTDAPAGTVGLRADGSLRDISPTMLGLLEMGRPTEMTGGDLRVVTPAV